MQIEIPTLECFRLFSSNTHTAHHSSPFSKSCYCVLESWMHVFNHQAGSNWYLFIKISEHQICINIYQYYLIIAWQPSVNLSNQSVFKLQYYNALMYPWRNAINADFMFSLMSYATQASFKSLFEANWYEVNVNQWMPETIGYIHENLKECSIKTLRS